MNIQNIPQIKHTESGNFFLLAGPCAIESEEMAMRIAEKLVGITDNLQIPFVFKGSFKKANRSRIDSFSGIGDEKALKILRKVSETFKVPTVTDIHTNEDADMAAQYVDVLQIPAFLVRQTDLVVAAANTGKVVNLKKGQFMSPESMKHAVQKVLDCNNQNFYQSKTIYKYFLNISFLSCFIFSGNSETKTPLEIRPPIDCSTSSHSVTIFCCISNGGSGI